MPEKKKIVYPTLEAEFARRGIRKCRVAESLGIQSRTLSNKLSGKLKFSLEEAIQIQKEWFSDMSINELFKREGGESDGSNQNGHHS